MNFLKIFARTPPLNRHVFLPKIFVKKQKQKTYDYEELAFSD
jgi:hypothetical protein